MDPKLANATRKMRHAMKMLGSSIRDEAEMARDFSGVIVGDRVGTTSSLTGRAKEDVKLVIYKDGEPVATVAINNGVLRRLKSELGFWAALKSGAAFAGRHNNKVSGSAGGI